MFNNDSLPFAALTVEQAGQLIKDIVHRELETIRIRNPDPPPESDTLLIDDAVAFLAGLGYIITKKSLYNKVSEKSIPHHRIGRRLAFSRAALAEWVEQNTERDTSRSDAALILATSARKRQ